MPTKGEATMKSLASTEPLVMTNLRTRLSSPWRWRPRSLSWTGVRRVGPRDIGDVDGGVLGRIILDTLDAIELMVAERILVFYFLVFLS